MNNMISVTTNGGQDMAANKNHLILKTTSNAAASADTNKSLENTLRNRKIILSSGLKRSSDAGANVEGQGGGHVGPYNGGGNVSTSLTRKQIIFANIN